MNSVLILCSSFAVVFALGTQQLNVTANRKWHAFFTSLLIGGATLVQFKLLPGPTTAVDVVGYLVGGAVGIVACMWLYPRVLPTVPVPVLIKAVPAHEGATRLGETIRLGLSIADEAARSDIERDCNSVELDGVKWWDTKAIDNPEAYTLSAISNAVAYLHMRQRLIKHPGDVGVVRFTR